MNKVKKNESENLTLLLKEKELEVRIAKQKAGFFARKHAEVLAKLEQTEVQRNNSENKISR